jgi:hypothetical protein
MHEIVRTELIKIMDAQKDTIDIFGDGKDGRTGPRGIHCYHCGYLRLC